MARANKTANIRTIGDTPFVAWQSSIACTLAGYRNLTGDVQVRTLDDGVELSSAGKRPFLEAKKGGIRLRQNTPGTLQIVTSHDLVWLLKLVRNVK